MILRVNLGKHGCLGQDWKPASKHASRQAGKKAEELLQRPFFCYFPGRGAGAGVDYVPWKYLPHTESPKNPFAPQL